MADIKKRAPKKVTIDYSKSKIYKIVNDVNDKIYVGSTTQTLSRRFTCHKSRAACNTDTTPIYTAMRELRIDHFKILLIENFPCKSKEELEAREYEILHTFAKESIYNARLGFTGITDEYRQKMRDNMIGKCGKDSTKFTRGGISDFKTVTKNVVYPGFKYSWMHNGIQKGKTFSYGTKRTREMAYMMAVDFQNQIYPLSNKDLLDELPFSE